MSQTDLPAAEREQLIKTLKQRFEKNMNRHDNLNWDQVQELLESSSRPKLWSLQQMEMTGGEPDVVALDENSEEIIFCDCSPESPAGRRSLCYDRRALEARKEHKPKDSALGMAATMGIEILSEEQYRALQQLGKFDTKTSSWVKTPADIRQLGGAIFCDRRYNTVFTYHNGADSYYAARGFRGLLALLS